MTTTPHIIHYTANNQTTTSGYISWTGLVYSLSELAGTYSHSELLENETSQTLTFTANDNVENRENFTIVSVEYGLAIGNNLDWSGNTGFFSYPVFSGTTSGDVDNTKDKDNTYWNTITNDSAGPGTGNWTWDDIDNLDIALYTELDDFIGDDCDYELASVYLRLELQDTGSYGLKVWDADGDITVDLTKRITRLFDSRVRTDGSDYTVSGTFTGLTTDDVAAISYCTEANKIPKQVGIINMHSTYLTVNITENNVTVFGETLVSGDSLIIVFGY